MVDAQVLEVRMVEHPVLVGCSLLYRLFTAFAPTVQVLAIVARSRDCPVMADASHLSLVNMHDSLLFQSHVIDVVHTAVRTIRRFMLILPTARRT